MEGKPTFDPRPFLDDDSRNLYEDPWACNIEPCKAVLHPPRVQVHAVLDVC